METNNPKIRIQSADGSRLTYTASTGAERMSSRETLSTRLEIFDTVENAATILAGITPQLNEAADLLQSYISKALSGRKDVLGIQARVKSPLSLQQKIVRKGLYKDYDEAADLLSDISDLIGLRIECRFIDDEKAIFEALRKFFWIENGDGLRRGESRSDILLELNSTQPQQQNNGMPIYRIDAVYMSRSIGRIRFEVQIKSLVNMFWGEVEHELIYKNNAYMLMDGFVRQMLSSTYESLKLVDNQLRTIYDTIQSRSVPVASSLLFMQQLLAKSMCDMFCTKMRASLGYTIDFRQSCDVIARYMIFKVRKNADETNPFSTLFYRMSYMANVHIDFQTPILLERHYRDERPFCSILGSYFEKHLNTDYQWNTFFRMLFIVEPGGNSEDLCSFLDTLYDRFADDAFFAPLYASGMTPYTVENAKQKLLSELADEMVRADDISILYEESLTAYEDLLKQKVADYAAANKEE